MSQSEKYKYKGICERCGDPFSSNSKSTHFCSKRCSGLSRSAKGCTRKRKAACAKCQKPFETYHRAKLYCSRTCSGLSRRVETPKPKQQFELVCNNCKKTYSTSKKAQVYCSIDCNGASKRDEEVPLALLQEANEVCKIRGSFFDYIQVKAGFGRKSVRLAVKRHNFQIRIKPRRQKTVPPGVAEKQYVTDAGCVICGDKRSTERAHIIPRTQGGTGKMENIIPLCPAHHKYFDKNLLSPEENRILQHAILIKRQIEPFLPLA